MSSQSISGRSVLVAPDSFKGTFSAAEIAAAVGRGLAAAGVGADLCPVADGGEGTLAALRGPLAAEFVEVATHDPLGRPLTAAFGLSADGRTAIVETAAASGLGLVAEHERDAWAASTAGTGELIAAAAQAGARTILLGVGGSATTDGGAGALEAIEAGGGLRGAHLVVLCDVTTPFADAARVFGPQKGADPALVAALSERLDALAAQLPRDPRGVPLTGCAGGLSGGLWAALGATLTPGAAWVLDSVGFDGRAAAADAVVTGEGRLDGQTLAGKLIGEIAERSRRAGVPLHAIVGSTTLAPDALTQIALAGVQTASTLDQIERAGELLGGRLAA